MNTKLAHNKTVTLVIGIGNLYRGDDALGIVVARLLKARDSADFAVIEQSGEGAALIDAWQDASTAIVVDAMNSGAEPGAIHRFDVSKEPLPRSIFHHSTHAFGLAEAIELARALGQLPKRLIVYGVEGERFTAGEALSAEVERAAVAMIERLLAETATVATLEVGSTLA